LDFLVVIERTFVYNWDMSTALATVVDELVGLDASRLCDGELRARFVQVRCEIDRLERYAARMLVGVHGRGVRAGEGASSTPVWVQSETGQRLRDARLALATGKACESLPLVAKAWAQGEISANAARDDRAGTAGRSRRRVRDDGRTHGRRRGRARLRGLGRDGPPLSDPL
jgi:hypothetical protein